MRNRYLLVRPNNLVAFRGKITVASILSNQPKWCLTIVLWLLLGVSMVAKVRHWRRYAAVEFRRALRRFVEGLP